MMAKRVSFSKKNVQLFEIGDHHSVTELALKDFYFPNGGRDWLHPRFIDYTYSEITAELAKRIQELEITSSLSLLSALEASFRIDYLLRCYNKLKDPLSRCLREIYKLRENHAALEEDILEAWKDHLHDNKGKRIVSDLIGVLKYRNWLAHGRYWEPTNWGRRRFDYATLYGLAIEVYNTLNFQK